MDVTDGASSTPNAATLSGVMDDVAGVLTRLRRLVTAIAVWAGVEDAAQRLNMSAHSLSSPGM